MTANATPAELTTTVQSTVTLFDEDAGTVTTHISQDKHWNTDVRLFAHTAVMRDIVSNGDEPVMFGQPSPAWSGNTAHVMAEVQWTPVNWTLNRQNHDSNSAYLYQDGSVAGILLTDTTTVYRQGNAHGTITNILPAGSVDPGTGYSPRYVNATLLSDTQTYALEQIHAGDADNTLYGYRSARDHHAYGGSVIDAGAGNDTVIGAGFADGGAGDDYLRDGDVLIGGDGNDTLLDGNVLFGGSGDDTMDGGEGATRYLIDPINWVTTRLQTAASPAPSKPARS
jgi:RTX calcium-binding nonapeptide repeat (4 copies)